METRKKLLCLAVTVALVGTATLYIYSASIEKSGNGVLNLKTVMDSPEKYLNKEISVSGNISGVKNYGNSTSFYLRDGGYSLICVSYSNTTIREERADVVGKLTYNEKWGIYELVVEKLEYEG